MATVELLGALAKVRYPRVFARGTASGRLYCLLGDPSLLQVGSEGLVAAWLSWHDGFVG